jgi:hypothetical protein
MKLSDDKLEKLLIKAFENLDKTKETCKVTVSQCLQKNDQFKVNSVIRSSLETIETTDLCKLFIINKSPNTKHCIAFTLKVLKTNINECEKILTLKICNDMVSFCLDVLKETYKLLKKIHDDI